MAINQQLRKFLEIKEQWLELQEKSEEKNLENKFYDILVMLLQEIDRINTTSLIEELMEIIEENVFKNSTLEKDNIPALKTLQSIYFAEQDYNLKGHLFLAIILRLKILFFAKTETTLISKKMLQETHKILACLGLKRQSLLANQQSIIILAGGTSKEVQHKFDLYSKNLLKAFQGYTGCVISGGTPSGISGIAGEIQSAYSESVHSIGYMPRTNPWNVPEDKRYASTVKTLGTDFSIFEPLQYWYDILCSDIPLLRIKLLGINGGNISAFEYRFALMFQITTGIVQDSEREATKIFQDPYWKTKPNLRSLNHSVEDFRQITEIKDEE